MMSIQERIIHRKLMGEIPLHSVPAEFKSTIKNNNAETDGVAFDKLNEAISQMDATKENYAFRPICSFRKLIGGLIIFFKRVVRKCLKWYIEPICFQQTDFNEATVSAVKQLRTASRHMEEVEGNYQDLLEQLRAASQRIEEVEGNYQDLAERLEAILKQHPQA